jgi:hypothetical protein
VENTFLMDSRLVHRSGTNTSDGARIGRSVRYTAPDGPATRPPKPRRRADQRRGPVVRQDQGEESTTVTILDTLDLTTAVTRVRVLTGEDADAARRADRTPIGKSDCTYYCPDAATAERCIEALRESDERLRSRPEELMLLGLAVHLRGARAGQPERRRHRSARGRLVRPGVLCRPSRRLVRRDAPADLPAAGHPARGHHRHLLVPDRLI